VREFAIDRIEKKLEVYEGLQTEWRTQNPNSNSRYSYIWVWILFYFKL